MDDITSGWLSSFLLRKCVSVSPTSGLGMGADGSAVMSPSDASESSSPGMAGIGVFGGMSSDVARTSPNPSMDRRATSDAAAAAAAATAAAACCGLNGPSSKASASSACIDRRIGECVGVASRDLGRSGLETLGIGTSEANSTLRRTGERGGDGSSTSVSGSVSVSRYSRSVVAGSDSPVSSTVSNSVLSDCAGRGAGGRKVSVFVKSRANDGVFGRRIGSRVRTVGYPPRPRPSRGISRELRKELDTRAGPGLSGSTLKSLMVAPRFVRVTDQK